MGCPTALVTAVAAVITSPGALLTLTPKMAPFLHFLSAGGVKKGSRERITARIPVNIIEPFDVREQVFLRGGYLGDRARCGFSRREFHVGRVDEAALPVCAVVVLKLRVALLGFQVLPAALPAGDKSE